MPAARHVVGFLLALPGVAAFACGYCVEDQVAAAYDHAVVMQAFGQKHPVAFFAIKGMPPPAAGADGAPQAIRAIIESVAGVDAGSARVAVASLSFAFDPQRITLEAVQRVLERKLAAQNLSLLPLQVMEQPGKLTAVGRSTGTE